MSSESLQSLSVAAVFVGLFFATLGGFGAFHFGRQAQRAEERAHLRVVQAFRDRIALLESELDGQSGRIAVAEAKPAKPSPKEMPASGPAPTAHVPPPANAPPPVVEDARNVEANEALEILSGAKASTGKSLTLGAQQRAALVKRLSAHPNRHLVIHAVEGDPQALELASALEAAFREAHWKVQGVEVVTNHPPTPGLSLSTAVFPPADEFVAAYGALERAGFLVTSDLDPNHSGQGLILFVGPRH